MVVNSLRDRSCQAPRAVSGQGRDLPAATASAPSPKPQAPSPQFRAPRAQRERQATAASLYSGAMMMMPPFRPAATSATGFGAEIFFNRQIYASRRGVSLKKWNFVGILLNFAPVPSLQVAQRSRLNAHGSWLTAHGSPLMAHFHLIFRGNSRKAKAVDKDLRGV